MHKNIVDIQFIDVPRLQIELPTAEDVEQEYKDYQDADCDVSDYFISQRRGIEAFIVYRIHKPHIYVYTA